MIVQVYFKLVFMTVSTDVFVSSPYPCYSIFVLSSMLPSVCFLSTGQQPMCPHPSNIQSQQAPRASTQAPALLNMVLMVRGSTWALN